MEVQRNFFIFSFLFISFVLWQAWENHLIVNNKNFKKQETVIHVPSTVNRNNWITIKNDVINLVINLHGGDIEEASLLKYKDKLCSSKPFKLLETTPNFIYQAKSGLIGKDGLDNLDTNYRPLYIAKKKYFKLNKNHKEISVPLVFVGKNGVVYIKKFILKAGEYTIRIEYDIYNSTNKPLELKMFGKLNQTIDLPHTRDSDSSNFALQSFRGAAYSSSDKKYEKYKFNDISDNKNLYISTKNGWAAMLQKYFATAWILDNSRENIIYTENINHGIASIGYQSSLINIPIHSRTILQSKLWIGPEIQKKMLLVAPYLNLTVDYGYLWFLSQPLFYLLSWLYSIIGNWGFSIIFITFIMRILTYPLTKAQYVSMAKMRLLQPKIHAIKLKYENDKKRMSQEIMLLYKKEKINPLGGCLPVLIQMPIFLSLYYMLMCSVELRHAPFLLWIKDLSNQDPYYVLPILMGMTMFVIQKISSSSVTDPLQQKMINFMPIIFTLFFLWFPSGLVLYYIVSNLVTIIQQKFVLSHLDKK